jgi:hypothetical protein
VNGKRRYATKIHPPASCFHTNPHNTKGNHDMTNPHPNPVVYLDAVMDALNADLYNPETPMIPMHAITLIRDAFTAVGVDFDLSKGVAA